MERSRDALTESFEGYPPVMTSAQVCEALAIGDTTLSRLVRDELLRPFTYQGSRMRRFLKGHVMDYVRTTSKEMD